MLGAQVINYYKYFCLQVQRSWEGVQANIGSFQRLFSPNKMLVVDNNRSEQELVTQTLNTASRFIRSRLRTKPESGIAMSWIKKELELKRRWDLKTS